MAGMRVLRTSIGDAGHILFSSDHKLLNLVEVRFLGEVTIAMERGAYVARVGRRIVGSTRKNGQWRVSKKLTSQEAWAAINVLDAWTRELNAPPPAWKRGSVER